MRPRKHNSYINIVFSGQYPTEREFADEGTKSQEDSMASPWQCELDPKIPFILVHILHCLQIFKAWIFTISDLVLGVTICPLWK